MVQKWVPFWVPVFVNFGSQNGPQNGPKTGQKIIILGSIFGSVCFDVLELFRGLLGPLLGLLRLSSEASGPQKHEKTEGFSRFLKMQLFWSLKLLMALLGSSCPLLGQI